MTVINLKTGKARTTKKEPLPKCKICNTDVKVDGGLSGKIGMLLVSFCYICTTGIVQMLMDKQDKE